MPGRRRAPPRTRAMRVGKRSGGYSTADVRSTVTSGSKGSHGRRGWGLDGQSPGVRGAESSSKRRQCAKSGADHQVKAVTGSASEATAAAGRGCPAEPGNQPVKGPQPSRQSAIVGRGQITLTHAAANNGHQSRRQSDLDGARRGKTRQASIGCCAPSDAVLKPPVTLRRAPPVLSVSQPAARIRATSASAAM